MTNDQKTRYESLKQMAQEELNHLDEELSKEVARAKQIIEGLQNSKRIVKQIYDNACTLLGVESTVEVLDYELNEIEKQV